MYCYSKEELSSSHLANNMVIYVQVFTIRRIIGEEILDRNEALWTEVDALEDILREAQVIRWCWCSTSSHIS